MFRKEFLLVFLVDVGHGLIRSRTDIFSSGKGKKKGRGKVNKR